MGIFKAFKGSVVSTFLDQWKEIITAGEFHEHSLVVPGVLKTRDNGRGVNNPGSEGVISNGSKIFVPENTAAVVFNQNAIENIVLISGGFEYLDGDESVFNGDGLFSPIAKQVKKRFGFGGITPDEKKIAFVNLREIRNIPFGTPGPMIYHDPGYDVDLEIHAWGNFSIRVTDVERFMQNYVPPCTAAYTLDEPKARRQIVAEFMQSFSSALNAMSTSYPASRLPSLENEIKCSLLKDTFGVGTWGTRFGFELVSAAINSIELSDNSKQLVNHFAGNRLDVRAYEGISRQASDIAATQKFAQGIREKGLDSAGMFFALNAVPGFGVGAASQSTNIDQQLETLQKLKNALDAGLLTQEEFNAKKKEILGLL